MQAESREDNPVPNSDNTQGNASVRPLSGVKICLVEDDRATAKVYARWMENAGAEVVWHSSYGQFRLAEGGPGGWSSEPKSAPELVVTDLILPDGSGLDIISLWRKQFPQSPILALTAFATVENAVETMKLGAFDFLRKPVQEEELVLVLRKAHEHAELLRENETLSSAVRILSMAQTLAGIGEKNQLLKTFGRLLYRETKAQECFVFYYQAGKKHAECLLDLRQPGMARVAPETILSGVLYPLLSNREPPPENFAALDVTTPLMPHMHERKDEQALIIELNSPTGNSAFVVLFDRFYGFTHSPHKEELFPIVVQAARTLQGLDVATALSFIDELTGLYNQRFLEVALAQEIARANRYGTPVSLLFFDLDKFKQINDVHGHVVGSQIIKEAARIFRSQIRDTDQLLRYGGDEFCAILPNTPLGGAAKLAERIREAFETTFFDVREITQVESARNLNVTASIGLAAFPECAQSALDLIQKADDAMYVSKRNGKNCVSIAKPKTA